MRGSPGLVCGSLGLVVMGEVVSSNPGAAYRMELTFFTLVCCKTVLMFA